MRCVWNESTMLVAVLENKPMIEGIGLKWLFDIDSLTQSMNYVPVTTCTVSNDSAGTSVENSQDCIVMPIWKDTSYFDSPTKDADNGEPKTAHDAQKQVEDGSNNENDEQERFAYDSSTKDVNVVGQQVNTASPDVNTSSLKLNVLAIVSTASPNEEDNTEEEQKFFGGTLQNSYIVPTHSHYKKTIKIIQIECDWWSVVTCSDKKYVKNILLNQGGSMQEELLNSTSTKFGYRWVLPNGKKAIRTKWVFRNKKDERGIVIRNKARFEELILEVNLLHSVDLVNPLVKDGDADDVDVHLYRSMIGSLMYLTASRPDIMFASYAVRLSVNTCKHVNTTARANVSAVKRTWAPKLQLDQNTSRHIKRGRDTKIPQSSGPPDKGSGPRCQDTILGDVNAQTRFEITSIQSIDPPLSRGYTLRSGEDSMKLIGIDEILYTTVI
ncbi:hypothetical protein Tco_0641124 [Tanacetum coccineum]